MKKSVTKFLKIAIPLALGIFLIWYSYSKFTPEQLQEIQVHFENANYWFISFAVFLGLLSHVSRAYRWNFMLEPLGYQPKLANNFMAVYIAYLMNIFIPKSGEVSRAVVLSKYEDVPFDKGFGTIISERIVDLIFLFGFTTVALMLQFDVLYAYLTEIIPARKLLVALLIMLGLSALFLLFLKYSRSLLQQKLKSFFSGLKEGVLSILTMKKKAMFILHTFLIWGLYLLSFYVATFALPETSNIAMGTIIITFVVGSFSFAFTNSGFGSYPFFVAGILAVFGIAETVGTAFGWIVWTSNIASIIFFGGLSFIMLPIYNRVGK
ncbi:MULTISPECIES: lysylphosphatidylglycerol synthase transmembrane domain-containing protein [Altibacter]|uniref:lysylphosphatidylglycerol synthase transmembrane domain-containing protein n=1 Tax=Altibacter TaxID=1535231 RepID=UPI00054CEFAD|nr:MULTISPECIES: lysylphosphatidylglycerol synthase transmembrane domain-containing protein [Altibacter]MCW9036915.1 flippase-like domain-containing protein [Altibacter sp.]